MTYRFCNKRHHTANIGDMTCSICGEEFFVTTDGLATIDELTFDELKKLLQYQLNRKTEFKEQIRYCNKELRIISKYMRLIKEVEK